MNHFSSRHNTHHTKWAKPGLVGAANWEIYFLSPDQDETVRAGEACPLLCADKTLFNSPGRGSKSGTHLIGLEFGLLLSWPLIKVTENCGDFMMK